MCVALLWKPVNQISSCMHCERVFSMDSLRRVYVCINSPSRIVMGVLWGAFWICQQSATQFNIRTSDSIPRYQLNPAILCHLLEPLLLGVNNATAGCRVCQSMSQQPLPIPDWKRTLRAEFDVKLECTTPFHVNMTMFHLKTKPTVKFSECFKWTVSDVCTYV